MNRSECPDVSPVTPELWDRIRAGLKKQPDMACSTVHFQYTICLPPFSFASPCIALFKVLQ